MTSTPPHETNDRDEYGEKTPAEVLVSDPAYVGANTTGSAVQFNAVTVGETTTPASPSIDILDTPAVSDSLDLPTSECNIDEKDNNRNDLIDLLHLASNKLADGSSLAPLLEHGAKALTAFDLISPIIHRDNVDIRDLLRDTRDELIDSYLAAALGRMKVAYAMLRGVMEGLFTSMYYREQSMSLHLWAGNEAFVMVHQMFEDKHDFYKYYKAHFDDERFSKQRYPETGSKKIFAEANKLYNTLSNFVHKKSPSARNEETVNFESAVERVFRIALCFLDSDDDLPSELTFPTPITYAQWLLDEASAKVKRGKHK